MLSLYHITCFLRNDRLLWGTVFSRRQVIIMSSGYREGSEILQARWQANSWNIFLKKKSISFRSRKASLSVSINFPFLHMLPPHRVAWTWRSLWRSWGFWETDTSLMRQDSATVLQGGHRWACTLYSETLPRWSRSCLSCLGPPGMTSLPFFPSHDHDGNPYFHVHIVLSYHGFSRSWVWRGKIWNNLQQHLEIWPLPNSHRHSGKDNNENNNNHDNGKCLITGNRRVSIKGRY